MPARGWGVGVRIARSLAGAGLLILLLQGSAYPYAASSTREAANALIEPKRPTAERALERADRLLKEASLRRRAATVGILLDTAWSALTPLSPRAWLGSTRRILSHLNQLRRRSPEEDRALEILEAGMRTGADGTQIAARYQALRAREVEELVARCLARAEQALAMGTPSAAQRALDRARDLGASASRIEPLERRVRAAQGHPGSAEAAPIAPPRPWEAAVAARLLLGRYSEVAASPSPGEPPDRVLARAVALHLTGRNQAAGRLLDGLSEQEGTVGKLAAHWLETRVTVASGHDGSQESLAERRQPLQEIATLLRVEPQRPHDLLSSLQLVAAVSERALRLPESAPRAVRKTAKRFVKERTASLRRSLVARTRSWIGRERDVEVPTDTHWEDAVLSLPRASTRYRPLSPRRLRISHAALKQLLAERESSLDAGLLEADAVLLEATAAHRVGAHARLLRAEGRALLSSLARGIEEGWLGSERDGQGALLENVRALDRAVAAGAALRLKPWLGATPSLGPALQKALVQGQEARFETVRLERHRKSLKLAGQLLGRSMHCPADLVCVDRVRPLRASFRARVSLMDTPRLGTRASLHGASLSIDLHGAQPRASLLLPVTRWLGLVRWLPIEVYVEVDPMGIAFGPRYAPHLREAELHH
ncbi:MAG: hypothetical protein ACE5FG_14780 [Myxococcota bacterium]